MKIPNFFNKAGASLQISNTRIYVTPHNLTSNTSDPRYIVSESTQLDTRAAFKAMDRDTGEDGHSHTNNGSNQWWKIQFTEAPVQILKFSITNRLGGSTSASGGSYLTLPYYLQGSNNDSDWETVYTINPGDMNDSSLGFFQFNVENSPQYKYWRIFQPGYNYLILGEVEFTYKLDTEYLNANDQTAKFKIGEQSQYSIEYENASKKPVTFKIIEGQLPDGIEFNENTGVFSGTASEQSINNLKILLSNTYNQVEITFKLIIFQSENNLVFHAKLIDFNESYAETGQMLIKSGKFENATIEERKCILFNDSAIYTESCPIVGKASFTQSLWFNLSKANTTDNIIFTMGDTQMYGCAHMKIQTFTSSYYTVRTGGWGFDYDVNTQFQYGKWYHLVQTYNAQTNQLKFYVNGILTTESSCSQMNLINFRTVIGAFPPVDQMIDNSYISDVRVYNKELSSIEIYNLYNDIELKLIVEDGLVFYMPFYNNYENPIIGNKLTVGDVAPTLERIGNINSIAFSDNVYLYDTNADYWTLTDYVAQFTASFWVYIKERPNSNFRRNIVFGENHGQGIEMSIAFNITNTQMELEFVTYFTISLGAYQTGKWYFVTVKTSENNMLCYLNGELKGNRGYRSKQVKSPFLGFNCYKDGTQYEAGIFPKTDVKYNLSSMRIYNRTLSDEEIALLASQHSFE